MAFQEKDAEFFFGRETFVDDLVRVVQQQPLVAVIGLSSSGKSSVVFAGLIPRLRDEGNWLIESFRPQKDPFFSLACALVRLLKPELDEIQQLEPAIKLNVEPEKWTLTLPQVVANLLKRHPGKRLLLVIDQFEELYSQDTEEQHQFVDTLLEAVRSAPRRLKLVLTLRADFLNYVLNYPPLGETLRQPTQ